MTKAWFERLMDVQRDGNCLLFCLFHLFPDIETKVVEDFSANEVCISLIIFNLRNSICIGIEKLSEEQKVECMIVPMVLC